MENNFLATNDPDDLFNSLLKKKLKDKEQAEERNTEAEVDDDGYDTDDGAEETPLGKAHKKFQEAIIPEKVKQFGQGASECAQKIYEGPEAFVEARLEEITRGKPISEEARTYLRESLEDQYFDLLYSQNVMRGVGVAGDLIGLGVEYGLRYSGITNKYTARAIHYIIDDALMFTGIKVAARGAGSLLTKAVKKGTKTGGKRSLEALNLESGRSGKAFFKSSTSAAFSESRFVNPTPLTTEQWLWKSNLSSTSSATAGGAKNVGQSIKAPAPWVVTVKNSEIGMEWGRGIQQQGMPWEDFIARSLPASARLPKNYETFDFYVKETGIAISAKTLNTLTASKLAAPRKLYYSLKKSIDSAANFSGARLMRVELLPEVIEHRILKVAIPYETNIYQMSEIFKAVEYAKLRGIALEIIEAG